MLNLFWRFTEFLLMYVINSGNNHLFDRIKYTNCSVLGVGLLLTLSLENGVNTQ